MVFSASNNFNYPASVNQYNPFGDRFIPLREGTITPIAFHRLMCRGESPYTEAPPPQGLDPIAANREVFNNQLCGAIHGVSLRGIQRSSILKYRVKKGFPLADVSNGNKRVEPQYNIPEKPERILDASEVATNVFCNVMSLSKSNVLGIGLGAKLYSCHVDTREVAELIDVGPHHAICSVDWLDEQNLVCGDSSSQITMVDIEMRLKFSLNLAEDPTAVFSLTSPTDSGTIICGTEDSQVCWVDPRVSEGDCFSSICTDSVCSLKLSPSERYLAAGCSDGNVSIYDLRNTFEPLTVLQSHGNGVLGAIWASENRLITGGGELEGCIDVWDMDQRTCIYTENMESQVTSLQLTRDGDIISTHGNPGNEIKLWNLSHRQRWLSQVASINYLDYSVLSSTLNPETNTLVTVSYNEDNGIIGMWKGFERRISNEPVLPPGILSFDHPNNGIR